jgi:tetratricopeptide (TPR) repeat protein
MKTHIIKLLLIMVVVFVPACSVWTNFTTYFNLYYNTSEAFQLAEEAIYLQERSIFETEDLSVPASANQHLNKVIEKASRILQFHSNSAYVDNALLLLGKSFFYQKNYLKALRKFQELEATQPGSSLLLENELWIAKTLIGLKDYQEALLTLESVRQKAAAEGEDEILSQTYIIEIIYYLTRGNYNEAILLADELLPVAGSSEQKAEILYETGNFYLKLDDPENALIAYERVSRFSPKYTVLLNTLTARGRTLRDLGRNEEALDIFENMRLEDKYRDNFDIIDYEIGMTYLVMDEIEDALESLAYVDTSYTTSQMSGLARYNIGRLYEDRLNNFDSASVYYQKAASSQLPSEKVREVHGRNQLFIKYKEIVNRIADAEKQRIYINDPEVFVRDSTVYYDSIKVLAELDSIQKSEEQRSGRGSQTGRSTDARLQNQTAFRQQQPPVRPRISIDSVNALLTRNRFDLANLYFGDMNKPDSAAVLFSQILSDTSAAEYHSRTMYALGNFYLTSGDSARADSLFYFIYDNYRTEQVANAAAVRIKKPLLNISYDPAEGIYIEAERLWFENKYDSSLVFYKQVYEEFPRSSYAPKALLASGIMLENDLNRLDSAAAVYDTISVRYPGTSYAQKISPKLIAYKQEQMRKQREIEDSLRVANQKADSLKMLESPIAAPDSISEAERIRLEIERAHQEGIETEPEPSDSIQIDIIKPDPIQQPKPGQTQERRNPRRR